MAKNAINRIFKDFPIFSPSCLGDSDIFVLSDIDINLIKVRLRVRQRVTWSKMLKEQSTEHICCKLVLHPESHLSDDVADVSVETIFSDFLVLAQAKSRLQNIEQLPHS